MTAEPIIKPALRPDGKPMTGRERQCLWRRVKSDYGPNAGMWVWIKTTPLPYQDEMAFYQAKGFKTEPPTDTVLMNGELVESSSTPPKIKRKRTKRGKI